jgi:hypothetical protein
VVVNRMVPVGSLIVMNAQSSARRANQLGRWRLVAAVVLGIIVLVILGVVVWWRLGHSTGTLALSVGGTREGVFDQNGREVFVVPAGGPPRVVSVDLAHGEYTVVSAEPAICPPREKVTVTAGQVNRLPIHSDLWLAGTRTLLPETLRPTARIEAKPRLSPMPGS